MAGTRLRPSRAALSATGSTAARSSSTGRSSASAPTVPPSAPAAARSWTYGELRDRVDRIAHVLTADLGVVPGNRVLLRGPTTPWLAACWLAVMKAGAVAVTVLAAQRAHELGTICEIAAGQPRAVRHPVGRRTGEGGGAGAADHDVRRRGARRSAAAGRRRGPEPYEAVETAADDVALIAFTSGTTGRPKGCMHFHRDVLAVADTFSAHVLRPEPDDVFAGSPPLGFTFGLGGLVVFPMRAGASALLLEQAGPQQLLPAIAAHRVSVLFTAPTAYRVMLDELDGARHRLAAALRVRRRESARGHLAGLAASGPGCASSTASARPSCCTSSSPRPTRRSARGPPGVPVPGGRRAWWTRAGVPVPDGEPGLLAVRGPVGCRYLADPRQREYVRDGWNLTGDTYVREPTATSAMSPAPTT